MICLTAFLVFSCDNDDDTPEVVPPRDRGEQAIADDQALIDYMSTHFYNYEEFILFFITHFYLRSIVLL